MSGQEFIKQPEQAATTTEEAVDYLTANERHPSLRVVGEYIRAEEITSVLDQDRTISAVYERTRPLRGQPDLVDTLSGDLGYSPGSYVGELNDAIDAMPSGTKAFIASYIDKVNAYIYDTYSELAETPQVQRLCMLLAQSVEHESTDRSLNESEKDQIIRQIFRHSVGVEPDRSHRKHPAYIDAVRRAEFMTMPDTQPVPDHYQSERLQHSYAMRAKEVYDTISRRIDPSYDPSSIQIVPAVDEDDGTMYLQERNEKEQQTNRFNLFDLKWMLEELLPSNPDFYGTAESQIILLQKVELYLATQPGLAKNRRLEDIRTTVNDPATYLYEHAKLSTERINSYTLGGIVHWLQRRGGYEWAKPEPAQGASGGLMTALRMFKLLSEVFRNREVSNTFFQQLKKNSVQYDGMSSLLEYIRETFDVHATLQGNPFHVMRFPDTLSVMPDKLRSAYNFTDYRAYAAANILATRAEMRGRKKCFSTLTEPSLIYLALPQYAPVTTLAIQYDGGPGSNTPLIDGIDYALEYEPKTGHYRIQLLTDQAQHAGKLGIEYKAGLDFIENQKNVPPLVTSFQLPADRLMQLSKSVQSAGFDKLAANLMHSFTPDKRYTADDIARAVQQSVYYSFAHHPSRDVRVSNRLVYAAIAGELDGTSLAEIGSDKKLGVQCQQVSTLYAMLLNYLLPVGSEQAHVSRQYVNVAGGLTGIAGFKAYSVTHADTQRVIANTSHPPLRFQKDVTPGPSLGTLVDATKSAGQDAKLIVQTLAKMSDALGKVSSYHEYMRRQERNFSQTIAGLKREVAESISEFNGNERDIEAFVSSDPRPYRQPHELIDLMQTRPLHAVANIILYLQDLNQNHGQDQSADLVLVADAVTINHILSSLLEWSRTAAQHTVPVRSSMDKQFREDILKAAPIAEELQKLLRI
jgi:hypothetical protein